MEKETLLPYDNIVLLVDEFPPAVAGGIATWAWELSEELESLGYRVVVIAPRKLLKRAPRAVCKAEVRYVGWHDWARLRGTYCFFGVAPLLLRGGRLLIVGSTWQHLTWIAAIGRFINAKVICFSHGTDATRAITLPRRPRFERVLRRIDLFAPVSMFLERLVQSNFQDIAFDSTVVYNGIDVHHFRPCPETRAAFRAEHAIAPDAIVVASAGRMVPAKGFDVLIRAFCVARRNNPLLHLCIAGKKVEEYYRLRELAMSLGVGPAVTFTDGIPYEKLPGFYSAADICVLASLPLREPYYIEESFGMVLLEAAGCGLPLIGTRCGGIPEIIEERKTGFLVAPGDVHGLAERIALLAGDGRMRAEMGRAASLRTANCFSRERMTGAFLDAAASVL